MASDKPAGSPKVNQLASKKGPALGTGYLSDAAKKAAARKKAMEDMLKEIG
jgi:hypothetical protein